MKLVILFSFFLAFGKTEKETEKSLIKNASQKEIPVEQKFVNSKIFNERYLNQNVPLVMKAAAGDLFRKKFYQKPFSFTTYLEVQSSQDNSARMMSIHQFLSIYEHEKIFIDSPIPTIIKSQMNIPQSLLCQPIVEGMKRTRLVFRFGEQMDDAFKVDGNHSMTCVVSGNVNYVLFNEPSQTENVLPDSVEQAIKEGSLDSYSVDLESGDCLFVPSRWFQRRSASGIHISVSLHWTQESESNQVECIQESKHDLLSLPFPDDPPMDIISIIEFNELHHFISEYYLSASPMDFGQFEKKLPSDKHLDGISEFDLECRDIAEEMFHQMDFNSDGKLSEEDFQTMSKEELRHLSGRLDDRLADFEDIKEDAKAERKGRSIVEEASSGTDDIRKLIEEGFGELFQDIEAAQVQKGSVEDQETAEMKRVENLIKNSISSGSQRDEL